MTGLEQRNIKFIPDFDSSSSMLFALSNYLHDSGEGAGIPLKFPLILGDLINVTPEMLRESFYRLSGMYESLNIRELKKIDDKYISSWITDRYPRKKYPAVMIGSSDGALIHLCSMLEIPWIPQTILIAVARKMHPDELIRDAEWGGEAASIIKNKIPYMKIYQMHDPVQDRIMVSNMGYFRVKRAGLGKYLEEYLDNALAPGGSIFISDCRLKWPAAEIGEDHFFQTGGLGDMEGNEYARGSERIRSFLKEENSTYEQWEPPGPLSDMPEAEWGFDDSLSQDILDYCAKRDLKVKRISYGYPGELSPLTADLTAYWYEKNGGRDRRLLVECFSLIEPWWAARTGSVPYWMPFNTGNSLRALTNYIDRSDGFKEIYLMLMSNAVNGVGSVPGEEWIKVIKRAKKHGDFIGVDLTKYPYDLGSFIKYHKDMQKKIKARYFLPQRMMIDEFLDLIKSKKAGSINIREENQTG